MDVKFNYPNQPMMSVEVVVGNKSYYFPYMSYHDSKLFEAGIRTLVGDLTQ